MSMQVKWYGSQVKAEVKDAAARGLALGAEHVLEEAQRVAPIEEGTLVRSGATAVDKGELRAAVSFDTPYAVRQHEELSWHHDAGRQAKYLESPLMGGPGRKAQELIGREIKKATG